MKLVKTLLIGVAAVSLVACSNYGTEVSKDGFVEEARKIEEEPNFTKAVVSYSYYSKSTGYKNAYGVDDENTNIKGKLNYTLKDGEFVLDAGQEVPEEVDEVEENVNHNIGDAVIQMASMSQEELQYYKFYKAPLGISYSLSSKSDGSETGAKGSMKMTAYMGFNKYGLLVKFTNENSANYSISMGDKTYKITATEKSSYEISYQ